MPIARAVGNLELNKIGSRQAAENGWVGKWVSGNQRRVDKTDGNV